MQDASGRERWGRTDATGRLVEVVEPIFWGSGSVAAGMATTYTYNTLGNITQIVQGSQTRTFKYDSLGRLLAQKLAEMNPVNFVDPAGLEQCFARFMVTIVYNSEGDIISQTWEFLFAYCIGGGGGGGGEGGGGGSGGQGGAAGAVVLLWPKRFWRKTRKLVTRSWQNRLAGPALL